MKDNRYRIKDYSFGRKNNCTMTLLCTRLDTFFFFKLRISLVPIENVSDINQQNKGETLKVLTYFTHHRRGITCIGNEIHSGIIIWLPEHSGTITPLGSIAPTSPLLLHVLKSDICLAEGLNQHNKSNLHGCEIIYNTGEPTLNLD